MSDIPESIVNRIRKLLAVANDERGNEHMAAIAAEKAQALLIEYNLTLAEVGDASPDATRENKMTDMSAARQWRVDLMVALAGNNFCMHFTREKMTRREGGGGKLRMRPYHCLIGRQANVAVTTATYEYLVTTMERLCPYDDKRGRSANSWLSGCTDRLSSRLYQLRQEAERSSRATDQPRGNGRDLVLTDVYSSEDDLNNDMRWGYEAGTTARNRREREARWAAAAEARKNEPPCEPETPEERAKREKADARYYARFRRQRERANARVDHHAYEQGSYAGESIGLDKQVHHKPVGAIG